MTVPAIHFKAKKHAFRQTQDGVVVSFVIHPNDMNADFAVAPLGTRYMVAVAKIGDDGNPIPPGATQGAAIGSAAADHPHPPERSAAPGGAKRERTLPEKVGMRCADKRFQKWIAEYVGWPAAATSAEETAGAVRGWCHVKYRAEILPGTDAAAAWLKLETQYLSETGQIAERRR